MLIHPNFDPIAIHLGPLAVRWYGLMYLVAFIAAIVVGRLRLRLPHVAAQGWTPKDIDDMLFYGVLGTILGGRLGYVLFYKASFYFAHPLDIFKVWEGGMSFHGGFLGVVFAMVLFAWQRHRTWLQVTDFVAPMVPTGLAAGRFGNFINGELWGRVTDPSAPWAMLFPGAANEDAAWLATHPQQAAQWHLADVFAQYHMLPRHPSELYEIALEGVALFFVMWFFSRKPRPVGAISAGVSDRLRPRSLHGRIRARTGRLPRIARAGVFDGPMAVAADDSRRHRDAVVGVSARRAAIVAGGECELSAS